MYNEWKVLKHWTKEYKIFIFWNIEHGKSLNILVLIDIDYTNTPPSLPYALKAHAKGPLWFRSWMTFVINNIDTHSIWKTNKADTENKSYFS